MKIERLKLTNFRNYSQLEIELGPKINIFIGNNGEGKTNILESIYILSLSKSHRSGLEENLIKYDESISKIDGLIRRDDLLNKQSIILTRQKKQLFFNNKEIRRNSDYVSKFCIISFTPDDLEVVKGSPNVRRSLINIDISQVNNQYIKYLNEYNQIIKMRNEYLKRLNIDGNKDIRYLDILNQKMIDNAVYIYKYRFSFFDKINSYVERIFNKITGLSNLKIIYNSTLGVNCFDEEKIRKNYINKTKKNFNAELLQGQTLIGPHRDDFSFILEDKDMKLFASQGQQRMAVISLKIAEIYLFKEELKENPVLLLDDIFSEIDSSKRNKIIKYLNNDIQSILILENLKLSEYKKFSKLFEEDVYKFIDLGTCVSRRNSYGGTSPNNIDVQIKYLIS